MAEPTKPIKVTCVVCSKQWETVPVLGYYECDGMWLSESDALGAGEPELEGVG